MKYIDADLLREEIEFAKSVYSHPKRVVHGVADAFRQDGRAAMCGDILKKMDSLQQEKSIKVYRVENEKEQKGLWRKFNGTWAPLFDMLTDGQCKDMPMEDNPIYREGGKQWFASAPSKETLQKWFSKRDLEELTAKGFTISEIEVVGYKKVSDFEYIFTRDNIISRTYLKVSDIYPQEQPELPDNLDEAAEEYEDWVESYSQSDFPTCVSFRQSFKAGAEWMARQIKQEQSEPTCKTCGFYENNCPFIRDTFKPYPNKICKDYTYSVMREYEQSEVDLEAEIQMQWDSFNHHLAEYGNEQEEVLWLNKCSFEDIAYQFYELGLNAIEYVRNDSVDKQMDTGWISVKDRLPEVGHFVLTCVSDTGTPQCVGMALLLEDGTWWDGDMKVRVDYWMEVPKFK